MRISTFYMICVIMTVLLLLLISSILKIDITFLQRWWIFLVPIIFKPLFPKSKFTKFINKLIFVKFTNKILHIK